MAKINKNSKNRAYAVALTVASRSSTPISSALTDSRKIAKDRSEKRSAADLNSMFAAAFDAVYK